MHLITVLAAILGGVAIWTDLRTRTIPSWIPLSLAAAGLMSQAVGGGWRGFGNSLGGAVAGFAVFFVFFWLGGMGGGDVKLMGGYGAILGLPWIWHAAFWVALIGAGLALAVLGFSRKARARSIPYAPAIVCGCGLVYWLKSIAQGGS